jgi:hypothetical protein
MKRSNPESAPPSSAMGGPKQRTESIRKPASRISLRNDNEGNISTARVEFSAGLHQRKDLGNGIFRRKEMLQNVQRKNSMKALSAKRRNPVGKEVWGQADWLAVAFSSTLESCCKDFS